MKHNLILYGLLLILSGFLIYNTSNLNKQQEVIEAKSLKISSDASELKYCRSFLNMYEDEIFFYFNYNGFRFEPNFALYDFDNKKHITLKDVGKQFFFAFDSGSCESCTTDQLFKLKSEYPELGDKVAILTTHQEDSQIALLKSRLKIPYPIYTYKSEESGNFRLMNIGQPFYFFTDDKLSLRNLFIVNDDHPTLNDRYLEYVMKGQQNKEISMN